MYNYIYIIIVIYIYSCNQCMYKQGKSESVDSCVGMHLFRVALCKCPGWIYLMVGKHKMAVAVKVCIYICGVMHIRRNGVKSTTSLFSVGGEWL